MNNERINTLTIIARHLRELAQGGTNLDEAYIWFNGQCKIHNLTSREEFKVVLMAGTMKMDLEKVPASVPWETERKYRDKVDGHFVVDDEVPQPMHPVGTFQDLVTRHIKNERKNPPIRPPVKSITPSAKCLKDARKALGAFPYDQGCNFLVGDGYFSRSCVDKYGSRQWEAALEQVRQEMKR